MNSSILVISIVLPAALDAVIEGLRARFPGSRVIALTGSIPPQRADEVIGWRSFTPGSLLAAVRSRHCDTIVIVLGRDQYLTFAFLKALALTICSGAARKAIWETHTDCFHGPFSSFRLLMRAAERASGWLVTNSYVCLLMCLLLPILIGICVTDLTETVVGARRKAYRRRQK